MADQDDLPFGLYERLITAGLKSRLLRFDPARARVVTDKVDSTEAHGVLARHVEAVVARALRELPSEERTAAGRLLVVIHTDRGDTIRLISARLAAPSERRSYEKENHS